jgi:hypothetical protein
MAAASIVPFSALAVFLPAHTRSSHPVWIKKSTAATRLESGKKKNGGTWTFCVDNVTKSGTTCDPAANGETCDTITAP